MTPSSQGLESPVKPGRFIIDVARRLGTSGDPGLDGAARQILADQFRCLWHQELIRDTLVDAARKLQAYHPWGEGWIAVRSTIFFDYTKRKDENDQLLPEKLAALERELRPRDLVSTIMTYVLNKGHDPWALDADYCHDDTSKHREAEKRLETKALRLGEDFAASDHELDELGSNLFANDWMPYLVVFGRGLAKGAHDLRVGWQQLVDKLEQQPEANKNFAVIGGFIEEADSINPSLAQELLDQCAQHAELRHVLVGLHPRRKFTETDLDRCMALLEDPDTRPRMYGPILWRDEYANLPRGRILDLAQRLLSKPNGDDVVLDALSRKLHGKEGTVDKLGSDLRLVGLRAAILKLQRDHSDLGGVIHHHMERVVGAALRFDGNEAEKQEWLDTIFAVVDENYGYIFAFDNAIETTVALMPEAFLNRVFEGTQVEHDRRLYFIQHGGSRRSPLANINVDVLIEWCRARNDTTVWASVATGISLWSKNGDQGGAVTISDSAIKLLEASPEPEGVLEAFAERVTPSSWSGSRANIMQPRAEAIGVLAEHERSKIAVAAKSVSAKLVKWIEHEKVREQREDEEREQRFE